MDTVIQVNARRWQDKSGNTYHTVRVIIIANGLRHDVRSPMTYGYGEQWMETASEIVSRFNGILPEDSNLRRYFHGHNGYRDGIWLTCDVVDVTRKSELHS